MCALSWKGGGLVSHQFYIVWLSLNLIGRINCGIIEIVEEQNCDNHEFRLTCRNLDTNLAIMESWFTPSDIIRATSVLPRLNSSFSDKATISPDVIFGTNGSFSEVKTSVEIATSATVVNNVRTRVPSCSSPVFQDSYLSTSIRRNKSREHLVVHDRNTSINLRTHLVYRCTGVNHCSFILRKDYAPAASWGDGAIYIKYACVDGYHEIASCQLYISTVYELEDGGEWDPNEDINTDNLADLESESPFRSKTIHGNGKTFPVLVSEASVQPKDFQLSRTFEDCYEYLMSGVHTFKLKGAMLNHPQSRLNRWCNVDVSAGPGSAGDMTGTGEGFIRTPGYPHYYVGESKCRWRVRAPPGQRLRITFYDISLRAIGPFEDRCRDSLTVIEGSTGEQLLSTCEQVDVPLELESAGEMLDVLLEADSKVAYPKRGVLFHYKTLGCVTPVSPSDGYLVYLGAGVARYMCCLHRVFADTRQREREILCTRENIWNDTVPLPECVLESSKISTVKPSVSDDSNMLVDVVIPSLLIAALFIGNAFIVLIIYKYRKRKNEEQDEEFNIIPLNTSGQATHNSLANAV